MPLYDNIADALELTADGSTHALSLDNTGATFENNEAAEAEPQEAVWVKIDLSTYPALSVAINFDLVRTGGGAAFSPEFAVFKVVDASFDPNSPDFTKLDWTPSDSYVGDGSTDPPPQTINLTGGTGSSSGDDSETGIFYLAFNDWQYAEYGSADISYAIALPPFCFDAVDIINPDCATASVVSGRVQEDWPDWWDIGSNGYTREETTFKFTWPGAAGLYKMLVAGQLSAGGSGAADAIAIINGRPFLGIGGLSFSGTTPDSFYAYNGFDAATADVYDPSDRAWNPWLPLTPGDTVEIQILSSANLTGFAGFNAFQTSSICFENDPDAPASTYCTGAVNFEDVPLGDDWGDQDEWGGQRLIPDQIYAALGFTPDSHVTGSEFPWGIRWSDLDMVALADGTVYVIIHDSFEPTGSSPPSTDSHYLVVKKYDPGSDTWSQVATLAAPTGRKPLGGAACEVGPDGFVYFAWWECTTFTPGSPGLYQSDWHLVKMDPSDDSYAELGTGQHAVTVGSGASDETDNAEIFFGADLAPTICFSGDDIYVANVETVKVAPGFFATEWRRPFVWRWNGATWTNLNIPDPSLLGVSDPTHWEVTGENGFWDQLVMMVAADVGGPITDGITVAYCYFISEDGTRPFITIPYTTGGGWGTEILTDFVSIEGSWLTGYSAYGTSLIDPTIMWSDKLQKLVLTGDFLESSSGNNWEMFQMNDAGTDWEHLDNVLAPPSSAGDWRQSRGSAAIGPDGDIWRGMMADESGSTINWEPHVIKNADGYSFGYANASRKPPGRIAPWTDPQGNVWSDGLYISMSGTTNVRIRWVGNTCYMLLSLFVEPRLVNGDDFDVYAGDWPTGEGFYVLRGTYVPCTRFLPQIYRRVLG